MVSAVLRGIGQGVGLILGIMITVMIMQLSAFLLAKMGVFGEKEKQRVESVYGEETCPKKIK